jgi:hypothetical protein
MKTFKILAILAVTLVGTAMPPSIRASDEPKGKSTPAKATPAGQATSKSEDRSNSVATEDLKNTLEQAKTDNEGVAIWLDQVRKGHAGIKKLIRDYEVGDMTAHGEVLARIRTQVTALEKAADAILRRGPNFEKDLELYEASLKKAEATYSELAGLYQRKAVDAKNPRYQKLYRQLSDGASASARLMGDNRKGVDGTRANARRLLAEVAESREVLHDLSGFLEVGVGAGELAKSIEQFYRDMKAYNQELDQTVRNINDWLQRQENTSGDPPVAPSKPAA